MPVVLIGEDENGVAVVGLYETEEAAREAVHMRRVPWTERYRIMTPPMNGFIQRTFEYVLEEVKSSPVEQ